MSAAGNWCLIESDPGVFTELIRGFGKKSSLKCFFYLNMNPEKHTIKLKLVQLIFNWNWGKLEELVCVKNSDGNYVRNVLEGSN